MSPGGFNSKAQTNLFILLLVALLLFPLIFDRIVPAMDRSRFVQFSNYASSTNIYSEIFESNESSDIVFFGNSSGISSIYPSDIEMAITQMTNKSIRVRNLSITGNSLAVPFFLVKALIHYNKKPKYFFYIPPAESIEYLHPSSRNLFNTVEHFELLRNSQLGSGNFLKIYTIKILDSLSTFAHYILSWDIRIEANTREQSKRDKGSFYFGNSKLDPSSLNINFERSRSYYNTKEHLHTVDLSYSEQQLAWFNALKELCREHSIELVFLAFPFKKEGFKSNKINLPVSLHRKHDDLKTIGIPRKILEDQLNEKELETFNEDPSHFSKAYARLHTKWLIPQILTLVDGTNFDE